MITEGLFTALVRQAWSNPAALRSGDDGVDITYYNHQQQQQQQQQEQQRQPQFAANRNTGSAVAATTVTTTAAAPSYSPLDHPALLMAYCEASCNALLRYHYDMPILQPRTTYRMPRRTSPASVGHSRARPPRHSERNDMRGTASHRTSSPYGHLRRDGVPSMSPAASAASVTATTADMAYRVGRYTDLHGTANTRATTVEQTHGRWGYVDGNEDVSSGGVIFVEGRPSWSPRQVRYRDASGSSHHTYNYSSRQRGSSGAPFDRLNYGGFGEEEEEEEEEEEGGGDVEAEGSVDVVLEGRRTVRLGSQQMAHLSHHHRGGLPDAESLWTAMQRSRSRGSEEGGVATYEWREEEEEEEFVASPDSDLQTTQRGEGGV